MKKVALFVSLFVISMIVIVVVAFVCIDFSGHKSFEYDLYLNDSLAGTAKVHRYVTEDKIIYKSRTKYFTLPEYATVIQKLSLKRKTLMPLRFTDRAAGARGGIRSILLSQTGNRTDLLFVKGPVFFALKDFETGEKTTVFSPYNVMLYMPLMEMYDFRRKGAQFFEIMIPIDEPMPVLRDKIEMRYLRDEYIPLMGRRIAAERFIIRSRSIPEITVSLSRHAHLLLSVEIGKRRMRFVLKKPYRGPKDLFGGQGAAAAGPDDEAGSPGRTKIAPQALAGSGDGRRKVFFESGNLMLSGRLWIPPGTGTFPAVILVPEDGPRKNGQQLLFEALGRRLSSLGIAVLDFDGPGQGKSQGNFRELDDGKRICDIKAAVSFLEEHPSVNGKIDIIGYGGGGYLAMKAADQVFSGTSCICLGLSLDSEAIYTPQGLSVEAVRQILDMHGLGRFDNTYMKTVCDSMRENLKKIKGSNEDFLFFMSEKLPLKAYREYLDRRPYNSIISLKRPLLMIFGKDERNFRPKSVESLKTLLAGRAGVKIAVFRSLGTFAGRMEGSGENAYFKPNEDVVQLVRDWVTAPGHIRQY